MSKIDLEVEAPDFQLDDFSGAPFRLTSQRGKANVLLVFNRGFT